MTEKLLCPLARYCSDPGPVFRDGRDEVHCPVSLVAYAMAYHLPLPMISEMNAEELKILIDEYDLTCPKTQDIF